jgi:hypothetical protein
MNKQFSILFSAILFSGAILAQEVITSWNFDNGLQFPATGSGTLSLTGSIIVDFARTGIDPGLSVPAGLKETDDHKKGKSCNTYNYPAQGTNPKTAGLQLKVSTAGFKNILVSADVRQGGTSANKLMLQYTIDGTTWEKAITYTTDDNDTWYLRNFNFRNIPDVNNNPLFGIRFVTNFDDDVVGQEVYVPVSGSNVYASSGTIRYDNIIIRGERLTTPEEDRTPITEWKFDNQQLTPDVGNGTLELSGGISYESTWTRTGILVNQTIFDQGVYDYASVKDGFGLQTLNYPAVGSDKSAGIRLAINTNNFKDIYFSADVRHGGTAANQMILQYTTDGVNWIDAQSYYANSGDTWYKRSFDFSSIPTVSNNQQFGIRLVTAMVGNAYKATGFEKIYSTTGPIRFDNLKLIGRIITNLQPANSDKFFVQSGKQLQFNNLTEGTIVRVFNSAGIEVKSIQNPTLLDLDNFQAGIYIITINHIRRKIILN